MELVRFASFPSDESCSGFEKATAAILVLQFLPGAVFSALRTFVLSKSKLFGSLVFLLSLAPVGANLVFFGYGLSGQNFSPFGCAETDRITAAIEIRLVYISRVPLIVADVLLIYVTWTKLSSRGAMRTIRQSKRLSLSDILLRDGSVLFMLNVLHLVFSVTAVIADSGGSYLSVFTSPVTAILISRFLLELQKANQTVVRLDPDDPLHSSRHPFDDLYTPSFIASLGAFIPSDRPALSDTGSGFDSPRGSSSDSGEEEDATQTAASSSSV
ncbi:hypothetical protein OH76DRAFT_1403520 [Lentinus brumalis]|uniref:Uncharacterized protein n=1 Tax=Lentinus brumalis TaxID=2498619 RepID=A0A371DAR8_9APHY|nr:hypothetical protein OH76DRAFT_1403520 [Polyporus brumalis]